MIQLLMWRLWLDVWRIAEILSGIFVWPTSLFRNQHINFITPQFRINHNG
jgi:hypothetical protein